MSTRSYIGIELPDGKVKSIYVHSDGYISGVGKTLVDNYNTFEKAIKLFDFGDCSSLGDTLEDCSFYSRDWNREEENNQATTYNNEYLFYNSFKGDIFIEYIYLFKNDEWTVSEMSSHNNFERHKYIEDYYVLHTKPINVKDHKDFNRQIEGWTEKDMLSNLGEMLQETFGGENISVQGQKPTKKENLN